MASPILIADIGIDARLGGNEAVFTYLATPTTRKGMAFIIGLGSRESIGVVLDVREMRPGTLGFDPAKLKPLGEPVAGLDLPEAVIDTIKEVAHQTLCPLPVALGLALPPKAKDRLVTLWTRAVLRYDRGNAVAEEAWAALGSDGLIESKTKPLSDAVRRALVSLRKEGVVKSQLSLAPPKPSIKTQAFRLTSDSALIENFLEGEAKRKPAQSVTVMRLQGTEHTALTKAEIKALAGVTEPVVKALIDAKVLEKVSEGESERTKAHIPNPFQQKAIDAICKSLAGHKAERFLLYGITGSGKTEVYLRCAEESLKLGRPVLYVVPEIALTAQVVAQLKGRFGNRVALVHSVMSQSERLESWQKIRSGQVSVVLGPRSALFAPLSDIGLIVMDEEHEASYKQESAPRYHARNVATFLARRHRCPLILGSATPSIESFVDAQLGALTLLSLPSRAAAARLPEVQVVDMRELYKQKKAAILSPPLHDAMEAAFGRKEQVMLFLNRRAYSPFVMCRDCGLRFTCPNCDVALSLHQNDNRLRCHHCDFQRPTPDMCPRCESIKVSGFGIGVEKVQESVALLFPGQVVERLDRDVARRKGALEDILARFRSNDIDCLVGTQMIAKGLDFPNVTVVGVVSADISLNIPDFRASERTFQLLTQVAGRAGRGAKPGKVVIQTFSPDHVSVETAKNHDFEEMFTKVSEERRKAIYPPYCRLVNVILTGESRPELIQVSALIAGRLNAVMEGSQILGPADCPLSRIQNMFRRHVLIKCGEKTDLGQIDRAVQGVKLGKVRMTIDIDPYTLS